MAGEGDAERLVLLLEARIRDFEKNMQKAAGTADTNYSRMRRGSASATRQMEVDMVRSTTRINQALATTSARVGTFGVGLTKGFLAPVAGLLTLRAAISGTRAALDKFSAIADQSAAAGLDAEFFQGIAYHARQSGIEVSTMADAMATFNKLSGQAIEGRGKLFTALKSEHAALLDGVTAAATQEERFRLVVDAIRDAKDQTEAAVIAAAAFGDQGPRIAAAFKGGADEVDRTIKKLRDMGILVSRETIARADELGDEFELVTEVVDNNLKQALVNLGPIIVGLTGLIADWTRQLSIVLDQFKQVEDRQFLRPLQNQLVEIENRMSPLRDAIDQMKASLAKQDPTSGWAGTLSADIREKTEAYEALMDQALALQERIAQLQGKPAGAPSAPAAPSTPSTPTNPNTGFLGADLELALLNLPDVGTLDDVAGGVGEIASGFGEVASSAEEATIAIGGSADAVDQLREQWQTAEDMASSFASRIIGDVANGRDAVESLQDAFKDLGVQLLQMAADQAIKSLFSALIGTAIGGPAGGAAAGFIPGLTGPKLFARGTANTGGSTGQPVGVVHGQEAVIPLPAGGKVPVQLAGGARSNSVNVKVEQHYTIAGTVSDKDVAKMVRFGSEAAAKASIETVKRSLTGWMQEHQITGGIS